jgi:tetratricopeptide (TPR) repeat protein
MPDSPGQAGGISPLHKKRLQQAFAHASKAMEQEKCQHDYVTGLLTPCVVGDPAERAYAEKFLENLRKKYKNNRKGDPLAFIKERGARGAIKKALAESEKRVLTPAEWEEVFKHGTAILKINPWDISALTALATASEKLGYGDAELFYLKQAQESNPKDAEVNRQIALALDRRANFVGERALAQCQRAELEIARKLLDQAISCWHRVEEVRPNDEAPKRYISSIGAKKQRMEEDFKKRVEQQFAEANAPKKPAAPTKAAAAQAQAQPAEPEITPEERLKRKIAVKPKEVDNYLELAQLYIGTDRYADAEAVYAQALEVSKGNLDIREKWEDAQLRNLRQQLIRAKKRAQDGDDAAKKEYRRLRKLYHEKDFEICKSHCERYPNNLLFKYELGVRFESFGDYKAAIREFQLAQNDPRKKGVCLLELGKCFQQVRQFRLAMTNFESAVAEIPDRDADSKKEALYLAGNLAMSPDFNDLDMAEKHLTTLAGMDFSYKDVSALLDEISKRRNDGKDDDSGA